MLSMLKNFRNSEIRKLNGAFRINKNILGFNVPVEDFVIMQIIKTEKHLHEPIDNEGLFKMVILLLSLFNVNREIPKFTILHDHDEDVLLQKILFELKDIFVF